MSDPKQEHKVVEASDDGLIKVCSCGLKVEGPDAGSVMADHLFWESEM